MITGIHTWIWKQHSVVGHTTNRSQGHLCLKHGALALVLVMALHTSAGIISASYFIEDTLKWITKHNSSAPVLIKIIYLPYLLFTIQSWSRTDFTVELELLDILDHKSSAPFLFEKAIWSPCLTSIVLELKCLMQSSEIYVLVICARAWKIKIFHKATVSPTQNYLLNCWIYNHFPWLIMVTTWAFTGFPEMLSHVQPLLSFPTTRAVLPGTLHCNSEKRIQRDTSLKQLIQTGRAAELLGKGFQYWQRTALLKHSSSEQMGSQADRQMENADVRVQQKKRRENVQPIINHGYSGALQKDSRYIPAPWLSLGRGELP